MTRESIMEELRARGYQADLFSMMKNGVELDAIAIKIGEGIGQVFYTDSIIEEAEKKGWDMEKVIANILAMYEEHKDIKYDGSLLKNYGFILDHIFAGVQKTSTEDLIKRETFLDGIEAYLYISAGETTEGTYTLKVKDQYLMACGIGIEQAWEYALENVRKNTIIRSMDEVLAEIMGSEFSPVPELEIPLYIASNVNGIYGASAILNRKTLEEFGREHHTKHIAVLPSSIHEMILIPDGDTYNLDELGRMVQVINESDVKPEDRLTDKAYCINI